jgi:hypothetical protein
MSDSSDSDSSDVYPDPGNSTGRMPFGFTAANETANAKHSKKEPPLNTSSLTPVISPSSPAFPQKYPTMAVPFAPVVPLFQAPSDFNAPRRSTSSNVPLWAGQDLIKSQEGPVLSVNNKFPENLLSQSQIISDEKESPKPHASEKIPPPPLKHPEGFLSFSQIISTEKESPKPHASEKMPPPPLNRVGTGTGLVARPASGPRLEPPNNRKIVEEKKGIEKSEIKSEEKKSFHEEEKKKELIGEQKKVNGNVKVKEKKCVQCDKKKIEVNLPCEHGLCGGCLEKIVTQSAEGLKLKKTVSYRTYIKVNCTVCRSLLPRKVYKDEVFYRALIEKAKIISEVEGYSEQCVCCGSQCRKTDLQGNCKHYCRDCYYFSMRIGLYKCIYCSQSMGTKECIEEKKLQCALCNKEESVLNEHFIGICRDHITCHACTAKVYANKNCLICEKNVEELGKMKITARLYLKSLLSNN